MIEYKVRVFKDSHKEWYVGDLYHREDGPAIEYDNGEQEWYIKGKCHREDGPAIIRPGIIEVWYKDNMIHREDGPAIIWLDGRKDDKEWYLNGARVTEADVKTKELTVAEIEALLGYRVKIVK